MRHDSACRDHRAVSDSHTGKNCRMSADPDVITDSDRRRTQVRALFRIKSVVERRDHHLLADKRSVSDDETALILKAAAAVDKHILSKYRILPAVCIERREHAE